MRRGFTLIELLIAVSIIAVLATIALTTYSSIQKKSRDAKRQSDIKVIQSALEQYHADQNFYPRNTSGYGVTGEWVFKLVTDVGYPLNSSTGNPNPPATTKTYLNKTPSDANLATDYCYKAIPASCDNTSSKCNSYELYANLENPPSGTTYSCTTGTYNLQVFPP